MSFSCCCRVSEVRIDVAKRYGSEVNNSASDSRRILANLNDVDAKRPGVPVSPSFRSDPKLSKQGSSRGSGVTSHSHHERFLLITKDQTIARAAFDRSICDLRASGVFVLPEKPRSLSMASECTRCAARFVPIKKSWETRSHFRSSALRRSGWSKSAWTRG